MTTKEIRKASAVRRVAQRVLGVILGIAVTLVVGVLLVANSQDGSVWLLQTYLYHSIWRYPPNSFEPRSPSRDEVRGDGLRVRHNVRYGERHPNSYLDIWYANADDRARRPTVIYMHGGGWFMGDKDSGDPLAAGGQGLASEPILPLARQGFNVVNLNYALAPAHRYPVQITQLNDAIGHLTQHASEYGLDMTNVVVMGGSAGAQMTAQYGLLVSDPAYAVEVGVKPAIDPSSVKALVIFAAPLKFSGFGWRMNAMLWSYLGTKDLENSPQARQVDIFSHLGPRYPATYLTDGNQPDTFPEHAKAMARLLREHQIDHQFNYYEPSEALLDHGYTGRLNTKHGQDNLQKAIAFIRQRTD
jgi:acetyl esterase